MEALGLATEEFNELAVSVHGRAEIRRRFVNALREADAADEFLGSLASDSATCLDMGQEQHGLITAAVLAGAVPTPLPAHQRIWNMGIKACGRLPGFESHWIAALDESGGWPVFSKGLDDINRWLQASLIERIRALQWLSGLRWDTAARMIADAVQSHKKPHLRLHSNELSDFARLAVAFLEKRAEELILQSTKEQALPVFVEHALRARLTASFYVVDQSSWIVRYRDLPSFGSLAIRVVRSLRNCSGYHRAVRVLTEAGIPGIEFETERYLKRAGESLQYECGDLITALMMRKPEKAIEVLSERPKILDYLHSDEFFATANVLPSDLRARLMNLFRQADLIHGLARMFDKSVVPNLKRAEQERRGNRELDRFKSMGPLVYLCSWPDEQVREALMVRIQVDPAGWTAKEAARLLAAQGEPQYLWERMQSRQQEEQHGLVAIDVFAIALGARDCGPLHASILDYLIETASGDPSNWSDRQYAAVIGLHALRPANVVQIMHRLLWECSSQVVRLLAAESLETMGELAGETALLPVWRRRYSREFGKYPPGDLALHDLESIRSHVCKMSGINLAFAQISLLEKDLDNDETRHLLEPERRRSLQIRLRGNE